MKNQLQNSNKNSVPLISVAKKNDRKSVSNNTAFKSPKCVSRHKLLCVLILFFTYNKIIFGHGVTVSNVSVTGQNTTDDYTFVQFDISWNDSWRNSVGTSNWDACWVFVKYRKKAETTWNHATLNTSGHTAPSNSTISTPSDGKGIFIYRSADMVQGSVNYTGTQLRWNYGTDGLDDDDEVEVWVFAIEMVYVPQGSFYVGDGTSTSLKGHFESRTSGNAFQISSEASITLGGGSAGSLGNNNTLGMATADDFDDATSQSLPADFPKGYSAFYCMKHSITQEQYVAFLNKLTRSQQNTRTETSLASGTTSVTNRYVMSKTSTLSYRNGIRCNASIHTSDPITFYCDLDGDGTANESNDGQNIACNYLSWADVAAYLDWAALRPMTELEYEKACRGNQTAVADEYAWGSTSRTQATGISNSGANNETASNSGANVAYGDHASVQGPLRVANFGQGVNTRIGVGSGYYGIMELSGNLWERTITVGNSTGRTYTGKAGNGALDASGNADVVGWPGTSATGSGFRGGSWYYNAVSLRVSDRYDASTTEDTRFFSSGGRGVRLAP